MYHLPPSVKITADMGVIGVVAIGWMGLIQPWLTAVATILAIVYTGFNLYYLLKKNRDEKGNDNKA